MANLTKLLGMQFRLIFMVRNGWVSCLRCPNDLWFKQTWLVRTQIAMVIESDLQKGTQKTSKSLKTNSQHVSLIIWCFFTCKAFQIQSSTIRLNGCEIIRFFLLQINNLTKLREMTTTAKKNRYEKWEILNSSRYQWTIILERYYEANTSWKHKSSALVFCIP